MTRLRFPQQWAAIQYAIHPVPRVTAKDRILGKNTSAVTVIEYADFECPYCAQMHNAMQQIARSGEVKWVYRHYPIAGLHPRALAAAEASECAGDQGKFWQFAAVLYEVQDAARSPLEGAVDRLQLDVDQFKTCMRTGKYTDVVSRQIRDGKRMRISGTPTYFINGRRFEGFRSEVDLRRAIADALDTAS